MKSALKCFMRLWLLVILIVSFTLSSCIDQEYDYKNWDKTLQVGGNSLSFPLGKTDKIRVQTLLDDLDVDLIKHLDDGSYALSIGDAIDFANSLPDFTKAIIIEGALNLKDTIYISRASLEKTGYSAERRSAPPVTDIKYHLEYEIPANIDVEGANHIKSLDTIMIENALLNLGFDFDLLDAEADMIVEIKFPKTYLFKEENGSKMTKEGDLTVFRDTVLLIGGKYELNPSLELEGLNFEGREFGEGDYKSFEDIILLNCSIELDPATINPEDIPDQLELLLATTMSDFSPVWAKGIVDLGIDDIRETLVLEGIPEFMRDDDCVLDLSNPHIAFELNSNAGLPVDGILKLVPYIRDTAVMDAIVIPYSLPKSPNPETVTNIKYWISKDEAFVPNGYQFIKSENLSNVFKKIPDSIVIFMEGRLDTEQNHVIDFKANYIADANYNLEVPFLFGPELHIVLRDTISNIPSILSEMLNEAGLELLIEVENSLPLELELQMSALDENNKQILLTTTKNVIKAASVAGASIKSDLKISLKREGASDSEIKALLMTFTATSPNHSELPIDDGDFLIADLKVKIPEGITIDLDDNK